MREVRWLNRRFPWLKVVLVGGFLAIMAIVGVVRGALGTEQGKEAVMIPEASQEGLAGSEGDLEASYGASQGISQGLSEEVLGALEGLNGVSTGVMGEIDGGRKEVLGAQEDEVTSVTPEEQRAEWLSSVKDKKLVALTFDDGPNKATTGKLLNILEKNDVRATFFVVGTRAKANRVLVKREFREGHEVGSHAWAHGNLTAMSKKKIEEDRKKTWKAIKAAIGENPSLTRAPYGALSGTVKSGVKTPLINWDVDPRDWADRKAATVRKRVVSAAHDGAIILIHDIYSSSVEAVPGIIKDLRRKGYEFVTVSELAKMRGVKLKTGKVYYNFRRY